MAYIPNVTKLMTYCKNIFLQYVNRYLNFAMLLYYSDKKKFNWKNH